MLAFPVLLFKPPFAPAMRANSRLAAKPFGLSDGALPPSAPIMA